MITSAATAPKADFEALLDETKKDLIIALKTSPSMSNSEFEDSVFRAMKNRAIGTAFEGEIKQTGDMEFPDIIADKYYGVEVKKTTKDTFRTAGNSIFEQTRIDGVEAIYILMANSETVRWKPYEEALDNIVVTHSPRYAINLDTTKTVFNKMGISYNDFRFLNQVDQMEKIKSLYQDRTLWWLSQSANINYRLWEHLTQTQKENFRCDVMILCPEIFGRDNKKKFKKANIYLLGHGVICGNIRDIFTAAGRVDMAGKEYPQIIGKLYDRREKIRARFKKIETKTIASFWSDGVMENVDQRWEQWLSKVKKESRIDVFNFFG